MISTRTTRITNTVLNADLPTASAAYGQTELQAAGYTPGSAHKRSGSNEMSDAVRAILWITRVAFGVVAADAVAKGGLDADARKRSPELQKFAVTCLFPFRRARSPRMTSLRKDRIMKIAPKTAALALLVATTQLAGAVHAEDRKTQAVMPVAHALPTVEQERAQLQEDKAELQRDELQLKADLKTLKADSKEGRMAAQSKDDERIYDDRRFIKGEMKDIAADRPGSLQKESDMAAMKREKEKLRTDVGRLNADTKSGRMAAESKDAEKVYQDRQDIKGEKMDIVADIGKLEADAKK